MKLEVSLLLVQVIASFETLAKDIRESNRTSIWSERMQNEDSIEQQNTVFLPKGSNLEKSPADFVRMPGTQWCGKGWRTDSFYSLGSYSSADRCCRQHDLGCPVSIQPGEIKYGLFNSRFHTVMHCTCDDRFRSCLKMARTKSADIVGNLFFNIGRIPCFVFVKTQVCKEKTWWGRCTVSVEEERGVWRRQIPYIN